MGGASRDGETQSEEHESEVDLTVGLSQTVCKTPGMKEYGLTAKE